MRFSCFVSNEIFAYSSTTSSTNSSAALDAGGLLHLSNPSDNMALMHKSEEMRLREHICQLKTIRSTIQGTWAWFFGIVSEHGRSCCKMKNFRTILCSIVHTFCRMHFSWVRTKMWKKGSFFILTLFGV